MNRLDGGPDDEGMKHSMMMAIPEDNYQRTQSVPRPSSDQQQDISVGRARFWVKALGCAGKKLIDDDDRVLSKAKPESLADESSPRGNQGSENFRTIPFFSLL